MLHLLSQSRVTEDSSPWLLLAAGAVVLALVLILIWPRLRGNGGAIAGPTRGTVDPTLAQQRAVERDIQTLMLELSDMARKVGAQLDARAARLEALIREADERLARLSALPGAPSDSNSNGHPADAPPPSITTSPEIEIDPRHAQIYALMDHGLNAYQIADRLGRPEGEVELIIALRPRGRAAI